jgi:Na+/proline symporter
MPPIPFSKKIFLFAAYFQSNPGFVNSPLQVPSSIGFAYLARNIFPAWDIGLLSVCTVRTAEENQCHC